MSVNQTQSTNMSVNQTQSTNMPEIIAQSIVPGNRESQKQKVKETVGNATIPSTSRRIFDDDPYVRCKKQVIYDASLSFKAKGVWMYGWSRPDGWKFYVNEICKHSTDGKDAVKAAIKELINAGYLKRNVLRDERGRITAYDYVFYESKQCLLEADFPLVDNPLAENPQLLIKDYKRLKTEELSVTQPPVGAGVIADPPKAEPPDPTEIGLIESHTVVDMVGNKTTIRFNDLFLMLMRENFEFKTLELKEAWQILKAYLGPISSIEKFMIGTIENLRKKQKSKDIKNSISQGERQCTTQVTQPSIEKTATQMTGFTREQLEQLRRA